VRARAAAVIAALVSGMGAHVPAAPATTLVIGPATSELTFSISRPGETIDGVTREFGGEVQLDPADLSSGSSVVLRVKAASLATGNRLRDRKMRGSHLEVDRFPEIVFRSTSIQVGESLRDGGTRKALVEGALSLHGVERTVLVPAVIRYDNGTLTAEGSVDLTYSDYGIPIPRFLWLVMDDAIKVRFRFVAAPAGR
jgi:polyisoprenoid-binding protein YceI